MNMNQHEIIITQRKIYEVISIICYGINKIWFENNYIISLNIIIISSQKNYEVMSLTYLVIKKIGSKTIISHHLKLSKQGHKNIMS